MPQVTSKIVFRRRSRHERVDAIVIDKRTAKSRKGWVSPHKRRGMFKFKQKGTLGRAEVLHRSEFTVRHG